MDLKPPKTYAEQLAILRDRGINVENEEKCLKILADVNYYRFKAYLFPFKRANGTYAPGTSFLRGYRIYEFDRKLRGVLLSAAERVEIYLRSHVAHYHAMKYGAEGYLDPENFSSDYNQKKFMENFSREISARENTPLVNHHLEEYGGHFPIWVATELFTFGMLSRFYADMRRSDQKALAKELYNTTYWKLQSWLRCCTNLRNSCAHYERLYDRIFAYVPAGINIGSGHEHRLWGEVLTLRALFPDEKEWNDEVLPRISVLISEYLDDIDLGCLGFPEDWETVLSGDTPLYRDRRGV